MKALAFILALSFSLAPTALADPCEAPLPTKLGSHFEGVVRYIVDGDGICVGTTDNPDTWIEVRLADFDAPELNTTEGKLAKTIARNELFLRHVECTTVKGRNGRTSSYDRVIALCTLNSRTMRQVLTDAGTPTGGN